jgi:hypothetical protein
VTAVTPPAGQRSYTTTLSMSGLGNYYYREDSKGRLAEIENPSVQTFRMEYDPDGKQTLLQYPNGVREERSYTGRDCWRASC